MRRAPWSLPAVAAVLLLFGCGNPTPTEPGGEPATATPTSSAGSTGTTPASPSTPIAPVPTKPGGSDGPGRPVTLDGVVEPGVEPGCKVLTVGGTTYEVLGAEVPVGVPVRVTGVLQPGVLTTCQQGTPIRVTAVQRR